MKKLSLLSAVALALTACGGGSKDLVQVDLPKLKLSGGEYKIDKKWELQGRNNGTFPGDTQVSPNARDGIVAMDHVAYTLETMPAGNVKPGVAAIYGDTESAPLNAGTVYYKGHILHADQAYAATANRTIKPYDVSSGVIKLKMDFTNKVFDGTANGAVKVVDSVQKFTTTEIKDESGAVTGHSKTYTGVSDPDVIVVGQRSYAFSGTINSTGYEGTATLVSEPSRPEFNDTAKTYEYEYGQRVAILGGIIEGKFYGPNAIETAGTVKFVGGNGEYNAAFGAVKE